MTRGEIETKLLGLKKTLASRIESAPLPGFFAGILIGVLCVVFWELVLSLVVLAVIGVLIVWLLSDASEHGAGTEGQE